MSQPLVAMGKIDTTRPVYRDIGHGCSSKQRRGHKPDIVYHEDVTGATRRHDSRRIMTGIALFLAAVIILILLLTF